MRSENTVVDDHKAENFKDNLRNLLLHATFTEMMGRIVWKSYLKNTAMEQVIKGQAQGLCMKIKHFIETLRVMTPDNKMDIEIIRNITDDLDPLGDKINNIAELTRIIGSSPNNYSQKIDFVFSRTRQRAILKEYWKAAGGTDEGFRLYHEERQELLNRANDESSRQEVRMLDHL